MSQIFKAYQYGVVPLRAVTVFQSVIAAGVSIELHVFRRPAFL